MPGPAAESLGAGTPAVGEVIAQKYRVESLVGRGGMGVVVSARHVQLDQVVAIKLLTLPSDEERRDEAIGRFVNEAKAAARLRSDHVVRIYDVGQLDGGLPFMVMELLSGSDLGSMLDERGPLPEAEAVDYVLQACAGVAEAHQMGIVHRDLKPSNLFVTRRSDGLPLLKVLDFGISKQLTDPISGDAVPSFTSTRTLLGSPNYMSPEQVRDSRSVDERADIWALGIILQELLTDAPVFYGESFPGVCAAIVADPPTPVRSLRPDVNERLEAIIKRCLQKDPKLRYQSVAELAVELSPLGSRASASTSGPQALVYSSQQRLPQPKLPARSKPPGLLDDPTVASSPPGSGPTPTPAPSGTLESARLPTSGGTHKGFSSTDSRVQIVQAPRVPARATRSLRRWALPAGIVLLLLGSVIWLQSRPPSTGADVGALSAPEPAPPTSFTLHIESEPPGASVSEDSARLGTTPFSLSLSLRESASPRVFVVEKDGYQPYVIRQGAARGEVRVVATLSMPMPDATAPSSAGPSLLSPPATTTVEPLKARPPVSKRPPAPATPQPASDIRLER